MCVCVGVSLGVEVFVCLGVCEGDGCEFGKKCITDGPGPA